MTKHCSDVLILGAGAAGLAAAAELAAAGHSALLLEARDRVGGRAWTRNEPDFPIPIEMGAEFIHGRAAATFDLLRKAGLAAMDAPESHWSLRDGKLEPMEERAFENIQQAMQRADILGRRDTSFENFLRRGTKYGLSAEECAFARMFVEGFDAADPALVSAHSIAEEWRSGGAADSPQFRPTGGYGALFTALVRRIGGSSVQLRLQTNIRTVKWRRGAVEMRGSTLGRPFQANARRAIVTLPLGILQLRAGVPGAVRFNPSLSAKRQALKYLAAGPVLKVMMRFRSAFWEELDRSRYRDAAFFHAPGFEFPTFWTALPLRAPMLIAWVGGPGAARMSNASEAQIVHRAVQCLKAIFGRRCDAAAQLEAAWCHNWQRDPLARGAYSYITAGGAGAREKLAAPLDETLFFAGEAADVAGEAGTVAGALQSGTSAARRIIEANLAYNSPPTRG